MEYSCRKFGANIINDSDKAKQMVDKAQTMLVEQDILEKTACWKIHKVDWMDTIRQNGIVSDRMIKELEAVGLQFEPYR